WHPGDGLPGVQSPGDPGLRGRRRAVIPRAIPRRHCVAVDRAARRYSPDPAAHDKDLSALSPTWPVIDLAALILFARSDQRPAFRAHQRQPPATQEQALAAVLIIDRVRTKGTMLRGMTHIVGLALFNLRHDIAT